MNDTVKIGSRKTRFEAEGPDGPTSWHMDLLATMERISAAVKERAAAGEPGNAFLQDVIDLVKAASGPELTLQQADEFWDAINLHYLNQKKTRAASVAMLTSPGPTASTRSP